MDKWELWATKIVDLVKEDGDLAITVVKDLVAGAKAVQEKDFGTLLFVLNKVLVDGQQLIESVKDAFK